LLQHDEKSVHLEWIDQDLTDAGLIGLQPPKVKLSVASKSIGLPGLGIQILCVASVSGSLAPAVYLTATSAVESCLTEASPRMNREPVGSGLSMLLTFWSQISGSMKRDSDETH
jgi:hypothetical protein